MNVRHLFENCVVLSFFDCGYYSLLSKLFTFICPEFVSVEFNYIVLDCFANNKRPSSLKDLKGELN